MTPAMGEPRPVSLACRLSRGAGSPIDALAIELATNGVRVVAARPLALDETVGFELGEGEGRIEGTARVICQERPDAYALRFAALSEQMAQRLQEAVIAGGPGGQVAA